MAIDDNTVYGLTGAQVKELPEKIEAVRGLAKVLTTDDYNYPANNPTKIAVWLLPDGTYNAKGIDAWWSTSSADSDGFFIKGTTSNNVPYAIFFTGGSMRLHLLSPSGSLNSERVILFKDDVINNLTSTSTNTPLSAAQGKALKDLIDSIVVPTKTSDLTNDGSDGTSTYVEADELATIATSGNYNDLSNTPTIPTVPTNVSAFTNDAGYQTASDVSSAVATETTARQAADANLQSQIDSIPATFTTNEWNALWA